MTTYQPKSKYRLPHGLYMQVLWKIRDYERLKRERLNVLYGSGGTADGMPRGSDVGQPTEQKALKLAYIDSQMAAVDEACTWIRGEYSGRVVEDFNPLDAFEDYGYFNYSYVRKGDDDLGPCIRTWKYFRARLCYKVAENLNMF